MERGRSSSPTNATSELVVPRSIPTGLPTGFRGSRICSSPDSAMGLLEELILEGADLAQKAVVVADAGHRTLGSLAVVAIEGGAQGLELAGPLGGDLVLEPPDADEVAGALGL